jgi:hypothetical protein
MKFFCAVSLVVVIFVFLIVVQETTVKLANNLLPSPLLPEEDRKENVEVLLALQRQLQKNMFYIRGDRNQCNISCFPVEFERGDISRVVNYPKQNSLHIIRSTVQEINSYYTQNKTFSYANRNLLFGARNRVSGSRIWQNSKGSQFSLPTDHVRRLKPWCMKITRRITESPQVSLQSIYD